MSGPFRRVASMGLSLLGAFGRAKPHFLQDYNFTLGRLLPTNDYDRAMQLCVGGDYDAMGKILADLLVHLGLRDHQLVVDVGCGSGRLSSALAGRFDIRYHGTDILQPLLDYARSRAPATYRFTRVDKTAIPENDGSADFITLFSVATHLMHHETYLYLEEARRVAVPGGQIVVSFLEFANTNHWPIFLKAVEAYRHRVTDPLTAFIETGVWRVWAEKLGLELVAIHNAGEPWIPTFEPVNSASGDGVVRLADFGQSCVILRKPQ